MNAISDGRSDGPRLSALEGAVGDVCLWSELQCCARTMKEVSDALITEIMKGAVDQL